MTREYPPEVYGGAGVHVDHLTRVLRQQVDLSVLCWGEPRPDATAYKPWDALAGEQPYLAALRALSIDLRHTDLCSREKRPTPTMQRWTRVEPRHWRSWWHPCSSASEHSTLGHAR